MRYIHHMNELASDGKSVTNFSRLVMCTQKNKTHRTDRICWPPIPHYKHSPEFFWRSIGRVQKKYLDSEIIT